MNAAAGSPRNLCRMHRRANGCCRSERVSTHGRLRKCQKRGFEMTAKFTIETAKSELQGEVGYTLDLESPFDQAKAVGGLENARSGT
jgi:hypothetical protein